MQTIRNESKTIGTDAITISPQKLPPNSTREAIFLQNTSAGGQTITLSVGKEAVAGEGIVIGTGGFYQDSTSEGYIPNQQEISAISSAAGGTLAIFERINAGGKNGV